MTNDTALFVKHYFEEFVDFNFEEFDVE